MSAYVEEFPYLGSVVMSNGRLHAEIDTLPMLAEPLDHSIKLFSMMTIYH